RRHLSQATSAQITPMTGPRTNSPNTRNKNSTSATTPPRPPPEVSRASATSSATPAARLNAAVAPHPTMNAFQGCSIQSDNHRVIALMLYAIGTRGKTAPPPDPRRNELLRPLVHIIRGLAIAVSHPLGSQPARHR